jgi:hypothetical protein
VWGCLDLWFGYNWWNGTCSHSQFMSSIVDEKKTKKKESDGGNCLWYYKLSMFIIPPKKGACLYMKYTNWRKLLNWVTGFTCLIYSSLNWFDFCSTSFNGFWATLPNISYLDPKPCYNPWKVLMIHVMHVVPVVENEKICKPMVDHFRWNEFERNTYPSNTWESSVYFREGLHF